ncbi:MAG: carboxypeptidase regulatory-like domain-containing protein, partial [Acidobacteria bacterium]|nr:carboxypeptidase regulatory-like domain-containing protein [Acidobacteriota bacterium]
MLQKVGLIILGVAFLVQFAGAQTTTGTISGVVSDSSGAVVPGTSVTVRNAETGVSRTLTTDAQGRYRAPNLSLGRYEVQASLAGFQTAVRSGITLAVGQEAVVNITLEVGQVTERVEVTGEAPLVEATRSDVSGVIEQRQVSDLPLNGRSYLQLALLQQGVVATRNTSNLSFGGPQTVLATSGSQSTAGLYLLDGTDISDYLFATSPGGASGMAIGVDMIREFRVLTNSFSAEYGRTTGGVLTVVSKGGTNQLAGTAFWFHRNDNTDARNFFAARKPEFKRNQWGATVGGPIVKDKTFFLGSYESLREGLGVASVAIVPNLQARQGILPANLGGNVGVAPGVKPFLDLYPLPNGQDFGNGTAQWQGSLNQPTREDFFSGRVDHVLSEKDTLYGRYTFRDGTTSVPFGSTAVPGYPGVGENRTQFTSVEETHVFSPTVLNTFRAAFNRNAR